MHKRAGDALQVLLVHPGGPFWAKKDRGAWSIPKGEYQQGEDPLAVARREFAEELGADLSAMPREHFLPLGDIRQSSKIVTAFAIEGEFDVGALISNRFEIEWPPKSGRMQSFPEVDRAAWFLHATAREMILPAQRELIDRLVTALAAAR